jgi:hypothetical protein
MLFNLILDKTVMADNLAKDKIDCYNFRYSRSRPRLTVASVADNDIMMEVVVVGASYKTV